MDKTDEYLRMAFWSLHTDDDPMNEAELRVMAADLQALCEDVVSYWNLWGRAPMLAERGEEEDE
jgi:hypothetical protein